jgi:tripartite-type tricarboxylate transporter receptor subunit TctC
MKQLMTLAALAAGLVLGAHTQAQAQKFPGAKPVRIIVPFAPGGSSDILGRLIAGSLKDAWGQAPVVENKPGASGAIGAEATAKSAPDGTTLLISDLGTMTALPSMVKTLAYDLHKDLAPVTSVSFSPYLIVVNPKLPPKSLQELIAYSKANPGKLNYATAGLGSNPHLAGLQFAKTLGIHWVFIPSKGGAQALQDVAGGHADLLFNSMLATAPHVKSGNVRLVGVTAPKRIEAYPEAVAASELIPGFSAGSWQGVFTTAGTPRDVVAQINADLVKVLNSPEVKDKITGMGAQVIANTPAEMDKFLREDRARWAKVVQEAGLKIE